VPTRALPGTNTGVGDVPHAPFGVAIVLEETLQLPLLHAWLDAPHDFAVSCTAHLVHIAQHRQLSWHLDHSAGGHDATGNMWTNK